jgi:hypothetical protein
LETTYTLTITGVKDLFGNTAKTTVQLIPTIIITIDGNVSDWAGITPIYSGPSGADGAADFQNIYVYNDANSYYFRVDLYHDIPPASGHFPAYVNMFFNTDGDAGTGYSAIGSDLLVQSGFSYQEKNGNFSDNVPINGLNWLSLPNSPSSSFEFSFSRSATFGDGTPVFSTNSLSFLFQGQTPGFMVLNSAPSDGSILTYSNVPAVIAPILPLGQLSIGAVPGGKIAVVWDTGTLQAGNSLSNSSFTNVPSAVSPYIIQSSGGQQFFRLTQ